MGFAFGFGDFGVGVLLPGDDACDVAAGDGVGGGATVVGVSMILSSMLERGVELDEGDDPFGAFGGVGIEVERRKAHKRHSYCMQFFG